jgi:transformation/transcription domain-associated protein
LELLQKSQNELSLSIKVSDSKEEDKIRDAIYDATSSIYESLSEVDYFAGLWRRRCCFYETNAAVSFEQNSMWSAAQSYYEQAQAKARTGILPFSECEYVLWEKQWIHCTKQLQQWDILIDYAKQDGNADLLLDCSWRSADWNMERESIVQTLHATSNTVRKKFFEAFLSLMRMSEASNDIAAFSKAHEDGIQLVLKHWHSLPNLVSSSHIPCLHEFQQFVELQEAIIMYQNLIGTNVNNIEQRSQELKGTLQTWLISFYFRRERLPNIWDDIVIWGDLVAWRQQFFTCVNRAYLPIINPLSNGGTSSNSHAYRGYHEIAWIINRFAHVARKHQLPDVCINALTKIYTLPNIEVNEAAFKLQEHAKCHMFLNCDYAAGLEVINNTNLGWFTQPQKADFFALKGQFFAYLNRFDDACNSFSNALQLEMGLPNAWAAWYLITIILGRNLMIAFLQEVTP